jgi:hypothetical protein
MRKIIVAFGLRVRQRRAVHLWLNTKELARLISYHEVNSAGYASFREERHLRLIGASLLLQILQNLFARILPYFTYCLVRPNSGNRLSLMRKIAAISATLAWLSPTTGTRKSGS